MSASDLGDQLQRAIALIQAGQRAEGRALLEEIVAIDPDQELAWLWLATVATERAERLRFLERALALNPANSTARRAYEQITGTPAPADAAVEGIPSADLPPRARPLITTGNLVIGMAVVAVAVAAILIALYVRDQNDAGDDDSPTATVIQPPAAIPTSRFSPTPRNTPRPTHTPGPSPTSVWDSELPTWTPAPSLTPAPTRAVYTWTPRPPTDTPTLTPTDTATPTPTDTPPPSATPRRTPTSAADVTGEADGDAPSALL